MPLKMPAPPKDFQTVEEEGTYLGICYQVIDLGTQKTTYQGETREQHKILIGWELPTEKMEDGRPLAVAKRYTLSASPKSHLRKDLESWRAKKYTDEEIAGLDITKLARAPAMLGITKEEREGNTYTNVSTVSKPMKGMEIPAMTNEPIALILTNEDFSQTEFDKLSDGLKKVVEKSPEYQAIKSGKPVQDVQGQADFDDEIPF